ncbi:hypothetical protein [Knoellia koreensis]|uniref:Tissue inhibitor of metalloproteinase n=1 Tax=Knoellia koreensis TaxID=2730921 RepID=A0A849H8M7_9MICO|nr:hypothetical protein [Knoellia sp. DB2414S]NNM46086.1 hypothetical protein [Knoellia sp. DB2414S]
MKRSLLVVLTLFAALLGLPTSKAWACSCAALTPAQAVAKADVVFRGTLTGVEDVPSGPVLTSKDPVNYTFTVGTAYQGSVERVAVVQSPRSGASCGLEGMEPGREYVVFGESKGAGTLAELCGGTATATPAFVADVEAAAGPGHEPVALPAAPDPATKDQPRVEPVTQTLETREQSRAWVVGGVALGLLLGAVLVAVARGRRNQWSR